MFSGWAFEVARCCLLFAGFRQDEGAQNRSMVGLICGDGDVRVRIRFVDPASSESDSAEATVALPMMAAVISRSGKNGFFMGVSLDRL